MCVCVCVVIIVSLSYTENLLIFNILRHLRDKRMEDQTKVRMTEGWREREECTIGRFSRHVKMLLRGILGVDGLSHL